MNTIEQKRAAREFVKRWKAMPCVEEEHSRSFWIELLQDVLDVPNATRVLEFERKVKGRKIDVFYEDMGVLVEMKGRGISLDEATVRSKKAGAETPFQQAKWYADNLPHSIRPRWIITCNFDEFRIYDLEHPEDVFTPLLLAEMPERLHLLSFLTNYTNSRLVREQELSVKAGEIVGKLYRAFAGQYKNLETDAHEQRSLNVLIVRIVFLLYAEDAGLLQRHQAFGDYLKSFEAKHMRQALIDLFRTLDTPTAERDPYLDADLAAFPYVNGGLFADEGIVIPQFTEGMRVDLVLNASVKFDWKDISPTIFGAVFESTLNPETRRAGGMHYTSIENIHKVIDPLFLDELRTELAAVEGESIERNRKLKLRRFQKKLASIRVLDPACGSGNFLTESYLSLRKLENRVIEDLQGDQMGFGLDGDAEPIEVSINQFYGIEINDFAVSVAKTALWIAEEQMMEATQEILLQEFDFLPLKSNSNIREGNALRMDWGEVLPAERCSYIIGNPPFIGASMCAASQKQEIVDLFGKIKLSNSLDYVSGWYYKAAEMMLGNPAIKAAFVSTNSITQGEQVYPIWNTLRSRFGIHIDFAWRTFVWNSETAGKAHVHCVIVGFSIGNGEGLIFDGGRSDGASSGRRDAVNPYLVYAPWVILASRKRPLCDVPALAYGNKPADNGQFVLTTEEKDELLAEEPEASRFIRPYIGAKEYLNGKQRWCIWLLGVDPREYSGMPLIFRRVENVRAFRQASSAKDTRKRAEAPWEFFRTPVHDVAYLAIPRTSSERRKYLPIGFFGTGTVPSDATSVIPDATAYHFGVLESQFHSAWMRTIAGRLKSDYRYSGDVVYNNFIWPDPTPEQRAVIESCAQGVLNAREAHPGATLADLYDPDKMPTDLLAAHKELDAAVEAAYDVDYNGDEEKIVAHLFKLYAEKAGEL